MGIDTWDEIRTAFQVARLGTVSGAAEVLGVHHATVIRHIDALEKRLGTRLFQRHARGYTATEAGQDLLAVAQTTDEQFAQLASRIKGLGETVAGELTVTAITGVADLLTPVFTRFQSDHPAVTVRFLTDMRVFRLDYGEAHVAIRAGNMPEEPDNVVQPLVRMRSALYAAPAYIDRFGLPEGETDLANHHFVGADNPESRAPFARWMRANLPREVVTFRTTEQGANEAAIAGGAGLGFMSVRAARAYPDLVQILPPRTEWEAPLWIVTHVDLHRTRKVQAFMTALKEAAKGWDI